MAMVAGDVEVVLDELRGDLYSTPNTETADGITSLLSAVAAGSVPCLEVLIQAGANPNVTAGGATPLHIAADSGNLEMIKCLLQAGGDPNTSDD